MLPGLVGRHLNAILRQVAVEGMPMYDVAVMVGSTVLLALGLWVLVRQRSLRFGGRVQDIPDAPPTPRRSRNRPG
jgi:hypothetical protein